MASKKHEILQRVLDEIESGKWNVAKPQNSDDRACYCLPSGCFGACGCGPTVPAPAPMSQDKKNSRMLNATFYTDICQDCRRGRHDLLMIRSASFGAKLTTEK